MKAFNLIYSIFCYAASILASQAFITQRDYKWVVEKEDSKCSQPCDEGVRNVTYKCIVYDDPTGITRDALFEDDCSDVPKPPTQVPCNEKPCKGKRSRRSSIKQRYEWVHTGQWTHCINGCFRGVHTDGEPFPDSPGKQCMVQGCFDNKMNKWVDDSVCKDVKKPFSVCQACTDYMSCPAMWSTSGWTACSRTCGRGTRVRSVTCIRHIGGQNVIRVNSNQCSVENNPARIETCGTTDCKPEFKASKWTKCSGASSWNCGMGTKKRKVICARLSRKGITEKLSFRTCYKLYGRKGFPKPWESCRNYKIPLSAECKAKRKHTRIFIHTNNATVVQMRRMRRMSLQVGEIAYVFPRTNVVIKCPVTGFDSRDLVWAHNSQVVRLNGRRIHMNYRGRLKIKRLRQKDKGKWRCIARNETAAVTVNLRYPTDGYREYIARLPLLSVESRNRMISDSPGAEGSEFATQTVQWVADKWSPCSSTCGKRGVMYRKVQCERLKDKSFKIFPDKTCLNQNLPKPRSKQACGGVTKCPEWKINPGPGVCTDVCIGVRRAMLKDKLYCAIGKQALPKDSCDSRKKPKAFDYCNNTECVPKWDASPWSLCSRTCGGQGVMARQLRCIWGKSQDNAGAYCYRMKLKQPRSLMPCQTPPCILACVDLSSSCIKVKPHLCRYPLLQRLCCATCVKVLKGKKV